ncbi:tetratricopeptide repeat protein [Devosia sp.]|uniref:tetratricopeptide repeat protein n=1 Tax=Devosia sp. TaxID=1871048 RepID=UPI002931CA3B|nr:tetratricopeptide repeat protein [Devosia sp.]
MRAGGESYGVIGALQAFPLRLATRRVQALGGRLHRNMTRGTTAVVLGRKLLGSKSQELIEQACGKARASSIPLLSENGFLRLLRSLPPVATANITRQSMLDQSLLDGDTLDLLALFDAFEHHAEPFSFRDVILAKKYAGLVASGASWSAIAKAVHQIGPVGSLTALTLQSEGPARIVARDAHSLAELDGQRLLPLPEIEEDAEDYFGLAESAEAAELFAEAATLYEHCAAIDPTDAVAAFNFGNCLRALGNLGEAATAYITAIKRDPEFVEAWFNHGGVLRDLGRIDAARLHLGQAVALDPAYADAVYNLAALEYDAHDLAAARQWWLRYLELDGTSDWARRARAGVGLANRLLNKVG